MINLLKGIVVGMGAISPGLSGSILLVIFKLYEKTIEAIGSIFKNFKKNILFLIPLFAGFGIGIFAFSKLVDYLIENFEMYTRFTFLGLVLGTVPVFYKEVRKKGFHKKYYIATGIAAVLGIILFFFNSNFFPVVTEMNIFQSILLGFVVAGSSIVPGIDSAVILSALGFYEIYVNSIANFNLSVIIPALAGLGAGALLISYFMNILLKKHYTITFSIIFGFFISIIPSVLNESCSLEFNIQSAIAIALLILGFTGSFLFGKLKA